MGKTDLSIYDNSWFNPGAGALKRAIWLLVNELFITNRLNPSSNVRVAVLRCFGAKIGKGVVVKPGVNVKYPWNLEMGDFCWIGENVWIDNLTKIIIGSNVCISQGAMLLCGNHDYKKSTFDLVVGEIHLEDGVWIGAKSVVCPGVTCKNHSVLAVNSVATRNLEPYGIYRGNPAVKVTDRTIA